jgi:hypothetical protein
MQVATTSPQTSRKLLAFGPDMATVLVVVALRKANLNSVIITNSVSDQNDPISV